MTGYLSDVNYVHRERRSSAVSRSLLRLTIGRRRRVNSQSLPAGGNLDFNEHGPTARDR
jgi:hypothetical protein